MFLLEICFEYLPLRFCERLHCKLLSLNSNCNIFLSSNRMIISSETLIEKDLNEILQCTFSSQPDSFIQKKIYFYRPLRSISIFGIEEQYAQNIISLLSPLKINETYITSLGYRKIVSVDNLLYLLKRYNNMPLNIKDDIGNKRVVRVGEKVDTSSLSQLKIRFLENTYVFSFEIRSKWRFDTFARLVKDLFDYSVIDNKNSYIVSCVIDMYSKRPSTNRILNSLKNNVEDKLQEIEFILSKDDLSIMNDNSKNMLFSESKTLFDVQQFAMSLCDTPICQNIMKYYFLERASKLFSFVHFDAIKGRLCQRILDISEEVMNGIMLLNDIDRASVLDNYDMDVLYCLFIKNSMDIASCDISKDEYSSQSDILFIRRKCFLICHIIFQNDNISFKAIWKNICIFFGKEEDYIYKLWLRISSNKLASFFNDININDDIDISMQTLENILDISDNIKHAKTILQERSIVFNSITKPLIKRIYKFLDNNIINIIELREEDFINDDVFLSIYREIHSIRLSEDVVNLLHRIIKIFDNTMIVSYNVDNRKRLLSFFINEVFKRGFINEKDVSAK